MTDKSNWLPPINGPEPYAVAPDENGRGWVLYAKVTPKNGANAGIPTWKAESYYGNMEQAFRGMLSKAAMNRYCWDDILGVLTQSVADVQRECERIRNQFTCNARGIPVKQNGGVDDDWGVRGTK